MTSSNAEKNPKKELPILHTGKKSYSSQDMKSIITETK
jgi:hypothetical protein